MKTVSVGTPEHLEGLIECILSGQVPAEDMPYWFEIYPDLSYRLQSVQKN